MTRGVAQSASRSPRVLITRLSAIGDCVQTLPVATALRRIYPQAHIAWALFSPLLEKFTMPVFRLVRSVLQSGETRRIEAHIDPGDAKAARFARALHFSFERTRLDLHPSGRPLDVYVHERSLWPIRSPGHS